MTAGPVALGEGLDEAGGAEVSRTRRRAAKISRPGEEVQVEAWWPFVLERGGMA